MKVFKIVLIPVFAFSLLLGGIAGSSNLEREFDAIGKMSLKQLTSRAKTVLDKKYPGENWELYKFQKYVYINHSVQTGYKIAVKNPELLAKFPCYCFCEPMGHKNLAYCFLEKGVKGNFDDHASACNICLTQAMVAFLWEDIGVPAAKMQEAMKEIQGQ